MEGGWVVEVGSNAFEGVSDLCALFEAKFGEEWRVGFEVSLT